MQIRRVLAASAATVVAATGLVACGSDSSDSEAESAAAGGPTAEDTIVIGTTDAQLEEWNVFQQLAEEAGYKVELQSFSDYNIPNEALDQGDLAANKFQHLKFLAEFNKGNGTDLAPLAATEIYPLALFWKDGDKSGLEGQDIAIPNDTTNQGRAINLLVQEGLVTLKDPEIDDPAPADVDTEASKVTITPIDAAQTASAYNEGKPAIINNSFWPQANVTIDDADLQDDPNSELAEPYINVWAVKSENVSNEVLVELAEIWKDPAVTEAVLESSGNSAVPVERSQEELQAILDRLESE